MKVEYKNDAEKGPGYGLLIFSEILFPSPPWSIALQRSYDQKFLAQGGNGNWVGETAYISLEGRTGADGSTLELFLDPAFVDSLDPQQQYRVSLKGADGDAETARLKLQAVAFSQGDQLDNTARAIRAPESPKAPPEETRAADPGKTPDQPVTEIPASAEKLEMKRPVETPKRRWPLALLALLVVGGLLGWVLVSVLPQNQESASSPSSPAREQKQAQSVEEQVRKFFGQASPTGAEAMKLAQKLPKSDAADQDAIYRLYYFASENNAPEAYFPYADCLNPALPAWGTIHKNAPDALKAYEKARQSRPEEAQTAIDGLLSWLKAQAAANNTQAREWLAQIQK